MRSQAFLETLSSDPPQLSEVTEVSVVAAELRGDAAFSILHSRQEPGESVLVWPDAGTCDDCWREFGDSSNRRFGYPFTACEGTPLERSRLLIETVPLAIYCPSCKKERTPVSVYQLCCPDCLVSAQDIVTAAR